MTKIVIFPKRSSKDHNNFFNKQDPYDIHGRLPVDFSQDFEEISTFLHFKILFVNSLREKIKVKINESNIQS